MAYKLSEKTFLKAMSLIPERSSKEDALCFEGIPGGKPAELEDFIRVLQAEKPSDVADISDDALIDILSNLGRLSECIGVENRFMNGNVLKKLRGMSGVRLKRRVL